MFTEHGVFYISIYLCEKTGEETPLNCRKGGNPDSLVSGTGLPPGTEMPSTAFTICPQNTQTFGADEAGMDIGQRLQDCRANVNYYSPKGAGHIAEKCQPGFECTRPGMLWPVARPGFWVSPTNPSKMIKCLHRGSCPGSSKFINATSACPSSMTPGAPFIDSKIDFANSIEDTNLGFSPCFAAQTGTGDVTQLTNPTEAALHQGRPYLPETCLEVVGSRCCPGTRGDGCNECCRPENERDESCNGELWRADGAGEGLHCAPCPHEPLSLAFVAGMVIGLAVINPIPLRS